MPHIHLLTSADLVENVDLPDILRALADELAAQESVEPRSIRAYHTLFHTWSMGEGAPSGFSHCRVSLLSGRSAEVKSRIADAMFARMKLCFAASAGRSEVLLSVELCEMDRETYRKAG